MHVVNYLSRHFRNTNNDEEDTSLTELLLSVSMTDSKKRIFQIEIEKDESLKNIIFLIA